MKTITVIIEGGGITEILNMPDDIMIEVRDYDINVSDFPKRLIKNLCKDKFGDFYLPSVFTKKVKYFPDDGKLNS